MISGRTKIYGIFGYPIEHTFSPGMHNAAFKKLGMDACYIPFAVHPDTLATAVRSILPLQLQGLNVTIPHKESVIPLMDELSEEARHIGAMNTIEVKEGRLIGHSTDGRGFLRSLREDAGFSPEGKKFLIVGAGGAGRAIGFSLALAGAGRISFRDVEHDRAAVLVRDIREKTGAQVHNLTEVSVEEHAADADCLINATPLGLQNSDPLPLQKDYISKKHLVCDLVYNPPETKLLKAAKSRGAGSVHGLGMLLYQGVIALEIWTGGKAPVTVMKNALARQIRLKKSR